ncbi:hypothetical protein SMSP2_01090 [Limihaloglobus sulfuriphilus]|uniref:Uncharacterized protein n=1 Tax=Limihaloglobus sulfuriphilus TaxID=1851148 RepID=A0A1Q2MDK7_9BACT|nr:hypothetical protein [Limihaloglobus sulfuriphilus]AQQ70729.1 hypothetical protein SMSP2_01090 [Limihaloglobus sulfuriphilus]
MKKKHILFRIVAVLLSLIIIWGVFVYPVLNAWTVGQLENISDLKYVGDYLDGLDTSDGIRYVQHTNVMSRGHFTVLISGTTKEKSFTNFFTSFIDYRVKQDNKTYYNNYQKDIYESFSESWSKHISKLGLNTKKMSGSSPDDLWGYANLESKNYTFKFVASYRKIDGSFLIGVSRY